MDKLKIPLTQLSFDIVKGIYTVGERTDAMPNRLRWLAPDAAKSYAEHLAHVCVVSDMWRSAESSLKAVREKRGAQPPSFSGHNYGLSIDLDIAASRKRLGPLIGAPKGMASKEQLDNFMNGTGWFCHRTDHLVEFEAWHFNFLGIGTVISPKVSTTGGYIEAEIVKRFSASWSGLSLADVQTMLAEVKAYNGEIDGLWGPLSTEAMRSVQRQWGLVVPDNKGKLVPRKKGIVYGQADAISVRTLVFVTAERESIVEIP